MARDRADRAQELRTSDGLFRAVSSSTGTVQDTLLVDRITGAAFADLAEAGTVAALETALQQALERGDAVTAVEAAAAAQWVRNSSVNLSREAVAAARKAVQGATVTRRDHQRVERIVRALDMLGERVDNLGIVVDLSGVAPDGAAGARTARLLRQVTPGTLDTGQRVFVDQAAAAARQRLTAEVGAHPVAEQLQGLLLLQETGQLPGDSNDVSGAQRVKDLQGCVWPGTTATSAPAGWYALDTSTGVCDLGATALAVEYGG